jgi:hypothetical protein
MLGNSRKRCFLFTDSVSGLLVPRTGQGISIRLVTSETFKLDQTSTQGCKWDRVSWHQTWRNLLNICKGLTDGLFCRHLLHAGFLLSSFSTMKMEVICSTKMSAHTALYPRRWQHSTCNCLSHHFLWGPCHIKAKQAHNFFSQSQSYITTDGQSVIMSWCRAQSGTFDQRYFFFPKLLSCLFLGRPLTRGRICHLSVFVNTVYSDQSVFT